VRSPKLVEDRGSASTGDAVFSEKPLQKQWFAPLGVGQGDSFRRLPSASVGFRRLPSLRTNIFFADL